MTQSLQSENENFRKAMLFRPINKYHKFLIDHFGGLSLLGCRAIASIAEEYALDENTELKNSINHYAEKTGITFDAVERNIRTYMNHIYQNYDYTALCNLFNYSFKPNGGNKVFLKEFIAVLKYTLDNESE